MGPFEGYEPNADAMLRVMRKHREAADEIDAELVPEGLLSAAKQSWDEAVSLGEQHGYRNAQASVLAPTGTIGLMMDCDTTGIEPELALVKTKKLVGGGTMQFVNQTVPRALERLGYDAAEVEDIVAYIAEHNSVNDAPHLKPEHRSVFDTAMGDAPIHYMGHVRMMAAAQPFISGAISKTVNMPEHVTVEEVEQLFVESWKLGLKAVAIYRDNCKVAQPMSADKKKTAAVPEGEPQTLPWSAKKRLPRSRPAITTSFRVGDAEGYITAGSYPDDGLGEIFLKASKQGSTLSGIMDAFSIAVSVGLQYGVPLEDYASKFINMKFEPSGMTDDADIRFASSIVDYVFRRLALDHLPPEKREALGIRSIEERKVEVAEKTARLPRATPWTPPVGGGADRRRPRARSSGRSSWWPSPRRRSSTRRSATSAAPRCSRPAPATSAGPAAAPAAARRIGAPRRAGDEAVVTRRRRPAGLLGLHHVQLAMPPDEEQAAIDFYEGVLGLDQVPKPPGARGPRRRLVPLGRPRGPSRRRGGVPARDEGAPRVPRRGPRAHARPGRDERLQGDRVRAVLRVPPRARARPVREPPRADRAGERVTWTCRSARLRPEGELPRAQHPGDAGLDLRAAEGVTVKPGERAMVPTGVAVAIPDGHAGLVLPRSGLASKQGLTLANAPGLIDAGYRGEVVCAVVNLDLHEAVEISPGDRIAQLVIVAVPEVSPAFVEELPDSSRGTGGFGSTGTS